MSADDHRALLRDSVATFVARSGGRTRVRALRGGDPGYDRDHWAGLASLGCIGALAPAELGGVDLTLGDMAAMLQSLAPGVAPEPVTAVSVGAVGLLCLDPQSTLAQALVPDIAAGTLIPSLAWQAADDEFPGPGGATLTDAAGAARLNGRKRFVVPAQGDGWLVTAQSEAGAALCWVRAGSKGVTARREPRADGTWSGDVTFTDVLVAPAHRAAGPKITAQAIAAVADRCHAAVAAELLGVAESALRITLDYLRVREQFGKLIGSFQALQHRAVDLYVQQELTRAALDAALDALSDASTPDRERSIAASRAKARAAQAALAICREAVQLHGAMGFADECDVGLHLRRALVLSAWLGNASVHRGRVQALLAQAGGKDAGEAKPMRATLDPQDWDAMPDEEFRLRVREIFEREYPPELRNPPRRLRWSECQRFYGSLGRLGLLALAWPKAFGGAGLGPRKQLIFMQEQDRHGVARAPDMGVTMVGPGLIRYGTPEQQRRYLPPILAMQEMWCQGFSEPDAGSDLAALRTSAEREGDGYVIEGAKTWTTFAHDATHMFLLARTDKTVKKQAGISVFLIDLRTPGITIRTIRDIAGHEEFCEVRFDGVRVPADAMLGKPNEGWTVAKMLLANERIYLGNPRQAQYALKRLDAIAAARGLEADAAFMARLTALRLDVWDLASLYQRFADQVRRGEALGPDVSILKLFGSETYQRLSELAVECIGAAGALDGEVDLGAGPDDVLSLFMNARPSTIYGGSNEVQRNVLARQVLELPA